jgi:hypothetical protein
MSSEQRPGVLRTLASPRVAGVRSPDCSRFLEVALTGTLPETVKHSTVTLLPHNRFGKTRKNSAVGEKVPEGRMRGLQSASTWTNSVPLTPTLSPALEVVRDGTIARGGEGAACRSAHASQSGVRTRVAGRGRHGLVLVLAVIAGCAAGCGEPPAKPRTALSGKVTLDGRTNFIGQVRFHPAKGNVGPVAATVIRNGAYSFTSENGPVAGPQQVVVELMVASSEGAPPEPKPGTKVLAPGTFRSYVRNETIAEPNGTLDFELK